MSGRERAAAVAAWAILFLAGNSAASADPPAQFIFNLPEEPLTKALKDVAAQIGLNVVAPEAVVQGRRSNSLSGKYTAEQAFARLLRGSGLQYRLVDSTIVIQNGSFRDRLSSGVGESGSPAITVTGTRIRGAGSASPVNVTTRRALEQAGVNDLADFTRVLTQNYTGGQNRGIAGGGEQGGQQNLNDSANLNLRGLGPDATLTLLNGHRLSYDALDQGVDISAIPLSAIDRIEIIADGASALYGSDAVAGVANIILRRDFTGLEINARVGGSTAGGNVQHEYSLVGGHRWAAGGFMVALDRTDASPVTAGQRRYTSSVDPSLFLTDRIHQTSIVLSGHAQLAPNLSLDLDGNAMNRTSLTQNPFSPTDDVHSSGIVSHAHVRSHGLTPTLRVDLGSWQASLSATEAGSRTLLGASTYFNSVPRISRLLYADRLKGAELAAEGPLVALPGGEARLAVGGGLRNVALHVHESVLSAGQYVTTEMFTESRNVQFAYGELSLPLVGPDLHFPLIDRLTLSAAVRYERWRGIEAETTPKVGVVLRPTQDVTIRATWGKSFKVPTLLQVNQVEEGDLLPGFIFSPPPQPSSSPVLLLAGSAPNLRPERATTWSASLELKPQVLPGLDLQGTYFNVDYRDRIAHPLTSVLTALNNPLYSDLIVYNPSAAQVNALITTLGGGLINQTGEPFDPAGVGAIIDASIRNTARQTIHGVDLNADYRVELGRNGQLLMTGAASYLKSRQQLAASQPSLPLAGTIFNPPHWRGRAGFSWECKRASLSGFVNYLGSRADNRFPAVEKIASFVTVDLNAAIRTDPGASLQRGIELRVSALNIFDQKPHFIRNVFPEAAPYDSTNESPVGRYLGVAVRKVW